MRTTGTKEVLRLEDISSYSISREDGTSSRSNRHFQRSEIGKVDASSTDMTSGTGNTRGTMNSAGRRTQMINGNHLLNFQYLPIFRPLPRVNSHRKPKNVQPYNKDRFLQANFKFIVLESGEYASEHRDPDNMLRWEDVVCVRYSTPSPVQCPICLEDPLSPQITSCGHIFCFPCIVRYLRMGEEDHIGHSWKKCPLCFALISSKELCTICIDNVREYNVGDILTFSLLTRAKDSLLPSQKVPQQGLKPSDRSYDPFSKFTVTSDVELAVREAQSELEDWLARADLGPVDDMEQLPYVCASLELLDERKKRWGEQQIKVYSNTGHHASEENPIYSPTCTLGGDVHAPKMSESLNKVQNRSNGILSGSLSSKSNLIQCEDNGETTKFKKSVDKCNDAKESYNFYQAFDGQLLILHPLNMKCLLHHFGSYDFLPPRISGKILQLETVVQSDAMRRRYRYLSHFPLTTSFKMCEIDMSEILPPEALAPFMAEIKKRQKDRNKLERKSDEAKAKAEAAETELLHMPFHFSDIQLLSPAAEPFSMDDFEALGNNSLLPTRSPPVSGERTRFSDVTRLGFAAAHDSPALTPKQPSHVSQISGSEGTKATAPAKLSYAGVISAAKTSNSSEAKKVAVEAQKKGKKASRVILSTAGGRRY